jgi:hypothetical protein
MRLVMAVMAAVLAPASVLAQPVSRWCTEKDHYVINADNEVTAAQKALTEANNQYNQAWSELQKWFHFNPVAPGGGPAPGFPAYQRAHMWYYQTSLKLQEAQKAYKHARANQRQTQAMAATCHAPGGPGQGSWAPQ